jgi:hypothetical protein
LPISLFAQTNRYFVSFKDKANSGYSISNPLQFLSQKSIDRRSRENFLVTEEDLPVNANYVQQVKATGAEVYFTSRWFNGVLIQTTPAMALSTVNALPFVQSVEFVAPGVRLSGGRVKADTKLGNTITEISFPSIPQNTMIGLDKMHSEGFYGEGVDVAVFDAGFNGVDTLAAFKPLFQEARIKSTFNFVQNSENVFAGYQHGTWVLSIMAGIIPDHYQGGVPKANFFLYQTEDAFSENRVEEYNWLFAAEKADSAGVDVVNSSLGYNQFDDPSMDYSYADMDGKTTVVARAARRLIDRGVVVVNAAGNEGNTPWRYIISPADVDGIVSSGGVDASSTHVSFSSVGPSSDGRVKPDVSAMAYSCSIINPNGSIGLGNGTSFASPLVACLATGLREALPAASGHEIYSLIINSASIATHPNYTLGYGIPDFKKGTELNGQYQVFPNPATSDSGIRINFSYPDGQTVQVLMYNSCGQKIFENGATMSLKNNPYIIDTSTLGSGLYYLKIQTSTGIQNIRIVKVN